MVLSLSRNSNKALTLGKTLLDSGLSPESAVEVVERRELRTEIGVLPRGWPKPEIEEWLPSRISVNPSVRS